MVVKEVNRGAAEMQMVRMYMCELPFIVVLRQEALRGGFRAMGICWRYLCRLDMYNVRTFSVRC